MFGGIPCQSCHMPQKEDGTHDHNFIGVDMDLSIPYQDNPLFDKVSDMLSSGVDLRFEVWDQSLPSTVSNLDTLEIPLTIESLTAHSIPSGTSFNREAWIEVVVKHNETIIYSSGMIADNTQELNINDENLILFKSYLFDEFGELTHMVINTHDMINNSLQAYSHRYNIYEVLIPDGLSGEINITIRMLFRPFDPQFILNHHEEFLNNLPVFEMAKIESNIPIQ